MAHATYPAVYYDDAAGSYVCMMKDKRTGRTWGTGYGMTREEAIYNARHDQPEESTIKKAIGWTTHRPFIGGALVGTILAYRFAKKHQIRMRVRDYFTIGAIAGSIAWIAGKAVKAVSESFNS